MDQSGLLFSNEALLLGEQSLKGGQMLAKLTIGVFLSFQEVCGGVVVFRGLLDAANHVWDNCLRCLDASRRRVRTVRTEFLGMIESVGAKKMD